MSPVSMKDYVSPFTTAPDIASAQRASWENIVNIETPVRRIAARMVGHVSPRLC